MSINLDKISNEILTSIEIQESQLLNWGFLTGSLDLKTELPRLIDKLPESILNDWLVSQNNGLSIEDIINNLKARKLIFELDNGNFRSRYSETIRLLYLLRQRFKKNDWLSARRLVSDMRMQLSRRKYPKRDIDINQFLNKLNNAKIADFKISVIKELLKDNLGTTYINLASFQEIAILKGLDNMNSNHDKGVVIGAGTGAGKTKAFYIPALAHIANNIDNSNPSLQVLAIYPRIELLKDQLAEAYSEVRKLDHLLTSNKKRSITIGAYYGDTPKSPKDFTSKYPPQRWKRSEDQLGFICPFFNCPNDSNHDLVWSLDDINAEIRLISTRNYGKYAILKCQSCDFETEPNELILSRLQLRNAPPDILFTTTEMLNRRMSRVSEHALFGIGQQKMPRYLLLDEIHTYEGIAGAQVAYLIRRWRFARGERSNQNLCIVGLSATLTDAASFFSRLSGIPEHNIDYISPGDEDYVEEGLEYNIVIKGDPVSGTSLLSTSVQSAMLLGRILDPINKKISKGAYGQRIFGFTDKLDVINRWYSIMYDAEFKLRLSQYRRQDNASELEAREANGQIWSLSELLGYDLTQPLGLGRTTSQDPGVNQNAKLIIATSTLEVGYNDVTVGAIIQHKAPRSMASFLQRKGRAGRTREMRPWMVVITSSYGRDRWAFQHAETLFNPELPPLNLPIENYYVHKIQAAYALMDWIAKKLGKYNSSIDVWELLSSGTNYQQSNRWSTQRNLIRNLLLNVLQGQLRGEFEKYLQQALDLHDEGPDIYSILWGEPRPMYLEVIPTLIRQLETDWQVVQDNNPIKWGDYIARQPMPLFIPSALFTDLNIPEVQIKFRTPQGQLRTETMSISQAINEYPPVHANKRFTLSYRKDTAHWLALPDEAQLTREKINLDLLKIDFDNAPYRITKNQDEYVVFRPLTIELDEIPDNVRSTSSSELYWESHFLPSKLNSNSTDRTVQDEISQALISTRWNDLIRNINVFTRSNNSWIDVTRFAIGVRIDTRYQDGRNSVRTLYFEEPYEGKFGGIGFSVSVDGIQVIIEPLNVHELKNHPRWKTLYRDFGPEFFKYKLKNDQRILESGLSTFAIDWLWQIELSMLTASAISRQYHLQDASVEVDSRRKAYADRTLKAIFQSQRDEGDDDETLGWLHKKLLEYLEDVNIRDAIKEASAALWNDNDPDLDDWLQKCHASSIGSAIFASITRLVPDIEPDELIMTVDGLNIWITESTPGGIGLISKIVDELTQYPRNLDLQLQDTIDFCEREHIARQLGAVAKLLSIGDDELITAFLNVRNRTDLPSLLNTKKEISSVLEKNGISASRTLMVGLNSKFLRPNSSNDSDDLITDLVDHWEKEMDRLGINIDLRVMAVAASQIESLNTKVHSLLNRIGGRQDKHDETQVFNLLQSMLWLNCHDSCPDCIEKWHPYQLTVRPSRALLRTLLHDDIEIIQYDSCEWTDRATNVLENEFLVKIECSISKTISCKRDLSILLSTPVDVGYQRFYPIIERIQREDKTWIFQIAISDLISG